MSTRGAIKRTLFKVLDRPFNSRLVSIQPASSCELRIAWPVSAIYIARGYSHERKSHKRHFAFPVYDFSLSDTRVSVRVLSALKPHSPLPTDSSPKAQRPLYYSKQIQPTVEGMRMASGRSLQTTCDRANMHFLQ